MPLYYWNYGSEAVAAVAAAAAAARTQDNRAHVHIRPQARAPLISGRSDVLVFFSEEQHGEPTWLPIRQSESSNKGYFGHDVFSNTQIQLSPTFSRNF